MVVELNDIDKPFILHGWPAEFIVGDDLLPDLGLGAPAVTRCERVQLPPLPPYFRWGAEFIEFACLGIPYHILKKYTRGRIQ